MPGEPCHAETAAGLLAWVTDTCTRRPAGISGSITGGTGLAAAQVHATLAVAAAVRDLAAALETAGAHAGDQVTEAAAELTAGLADMRGELTDQLYEICAVLDAPGWWQRVRLRRSARAAARAEGDQ